MPGLLLHSFGLNLANFEIVTGGLSHTAETISILDTSV